MKKQRKTRFGREISNGRHLVKVYEQAKELAPIVFFFNHKTAEGMDVVFDTVEQRERFLDVLFNTP